jgi:hypothetical protein
VRSTMLRDFFDFVAPRLIATLIAAALVAWSLSGLASHLTTASVRSLAAAIERGEEPHLAVFDRLDRENGPKSILARCDTADLRALVLVRLKELDLAYAAADPKRAERATGEAEGIIRKALSCSPLDGNNWLKLAALHIARTGATARAFEFIKLSQWTSPSEGRILRSRVNIASQVFAAGFKDVESELRSDIRTLVRFDATDSVATMYLIAPELVRPIYREWMELLPIERRKRIANAVERGGGNQNFK